MQPKINSFFKPSSSSSISSPDPPPIFEDGDDELTTWEKKEHVIVNTYKRAGPKFDGVSFEEKRPKRKEPISEDLCLKPRKLNKKRSYAQLHLDLGQSDFVLHKCSTCGLKYAAGDEDDEKSHKLFHKNYTHGIQFKGWQNERVVHMPCVEGGRIVLVLDCDSPAQRNKIHEVVKVMETELGSEWIFHKHCKVYLFICSQKIAGCLVAEPIKAGFKVLSCSVDEKTQGTTTPKEQRSSANTATTLQFGEIMLQREVLKRASCPNGNDITGGAIVCEKEPTPTVCGIRAIWVSPSNRRKGIATQLLDAARRSFSMGFVLEKSQVAFSQPTSAGKALASTYFSTQSFLVYKTHKLGC